jgi:hypothetical protein
MCEYADADHISIILIVSLCVCGITGAAFIAARNDHGYEMIKLQSEFGGKVGCINIACSLNLLNSCQLKCPLPPLLF